MRFARNRSRSGLMVRSSFDTAYHDGFERQAAAVVRPANREATVGSCTAKSTSAFFGSTPLEKYLRKESSDNNVKPSCASMPARTAPVGNFAESATKSSLASGARAAT